MPISARRTNTANEMAAPQAGVRCAATLPPIPPAHSRYPWSGIPGPTAPPTVAALPPGVARTHGAYDRPMRIAIAGGGPAGLYFALLIKKLEPAHEVVVYERKAPDDTFGFGVVFSDETLDAIEAADPPAFAAIARRFARWAEIDVHHRGETITSGGHGFSALSRRELLRILQERASEAGVDLRFRTEAPQDLQADLVVGADGVNSRVRARHAQAFRPSFERGRSKYIWLGTDRVFDAFKFYVADTGHGVFQVHGYPYSDAMSTFIVETSEESWRAAGMERASEEES